ncbi:ATP-binding cassette domain-containing protein [Actinoallomurus rhizosphaericola]|uniref:ATP-binding cassette domain-containing protein n=1 Tax=Actinoallomurus rhizosphaericola TaxID=2952536 RepID=UPI002090CAE8|nr:ATP-binding cassette domain-containing protein [Actinoallomurus rhizosphaericola]MCO5991737.1 ATP-binding cassette domain-containing protein [Actinoallomurus rhizosphaericola]
MDASPRSRRARRVPAGPDTPAAGRRSAPLPPGPYELRLADLRTRWPGGEVIGFGDADLLLPQGRRVALLGRSRVGASALAAVLLGFLDYQGVATLNDVQLRDLADEDVRGVIGLCAHDAHLFDTTIAENVRVARPDATDEDVARALREAGVDLPPDTRVDDQSVVVGAGRRRIALARALLADLPILILDEPDTGPEDPGADAALAGLIAAAEGRTLLLIMHRTVLPGAAPILRHVDEVLEI